MKKLCQFVVPLYGQEPEIITNSWKELSEFVDILLVVNDGIERSVEKYAFAKVTYNIENSIYGAWNLGLEAAKLNNHKTLIISGNDTYFPIITAHRFVDRIGNYGRKAVCAHTYHSFDCTEVVGEQCSLPIFLDKTLKIANPSFVTGIYFNCFALNVEWALDIVGGFDPRYKLYFGDTDFLITLHKLGFDNTCFQKDLSCLVYEYWKQGWETIATQSMDIDFLADTFADEAEFFYEKWKDQWNTIVVNNPFVDVRSGICNNGRFVGKKALRDLQFDNRSNSRFLASL